MTTDRTKKGPDAPTSDPRSSKSTDGSKVPPDPRRDHREALRIELWRLAQRHHPDDARQVWLAARVEHEPAQWRVDALDLAVVVRKADGMRRRDALAEVEAATAVLDADELTDWAVLADLGAMALLDVYRPEVLPERRLPAPAAVVIGVLS